ncbi:MULTISPECIES: ParA family protein [Agrobacterium]|jgi:chromosome partitioning protein|uniref:ParA family protein n=1 Tax=Agrobacterium TaxID=357 RepID=UPI0022B810C6|nr:MULTISPECIES: ParA family protein [Agrobacterium]MCZ7856946.1 ParA family protein [Agrobacterium salinitolerans]MCZ7885969.1 ParA family protein [Agrobacterium salinitolerans]MDA5627987.1 ParA family protein [Agrobacterium sp. ST15.16.055]MDA5637112.1 ParA family protein [Agrobacterium sp. ST15.13.013]MDA6978267.1 ParA family protein [Agrobacterium salinitolerans]
MSVITFANTKGGAGKTTAVLLLATELARSGHRVTVLDADPQLWISRWYDLSGSVENLAVISHVTMASLEAHIRENRANTDCFIIDLPGAKTPLLTMALGISDHVLIPVQGSAMDARGAAEVLDHIEFLNRRMGKEIAHSIVLTRVNAMVATRSLLLVKMLLAEKNVSVLNTAIVERAAYRDIFDYGGTLLCLDGKKVSNIDKAVENAAAFAEEVISLLPKRLPRRVAHLARLVTRRAA